METGPAREAVGAGQQAASHGGGVEAGARAKKQAEPAKALGLEFPRYFTLAGVDLSLPAGMVTAAAAYAVGLTRRARD